MVRAQDVINIYQSLLDNGIQVWLTGGWGIDALLGEQTRPHKDLDVIMLLDDVVRTRELLGRDGYRLKMLWSENRWDVDAHGVETATAFVLHDSEGREFDAHAMRLDDQGNGIPAWEAEGFIFTRQDLAGQGTIAGVAVRCLTPQMQMFCHTGYELPDEHLSDLELIRAKFGVQHPDTEQPEDMAAFFDVRAAGYDDHIRDNIFESHETFTQFYQAMSSPIEKTDKPLKILDLGCGTGLEIDALLQRVPNALITGVDVSTNMLQRLRKRYSTHMSQITLVAESYLTMPVGTHAYDHIISALSLHHLLRATKLKLYLKIYTALKPGGKYIEGDSVVFAETESQLLAEYHECVACMPQAIDGHYHIDVPFSIDSQRSLLLEAGFKDFNVVWQKDSTVDWNIAVYVVTT